MLTPTDFQNKISDIQKECLNAIIDLLKNNNRYWEHKEGDEDFIILRTNFGSPIIWALRLDENNKVYFKDSLYGSPTQPLICKSGFWKELSSRYSLDIYNGLYKKLRN